MVPSRRHRLFSGAWLLLTSILGCLKRMDSERRKSVLVIEKQPNYTQLLVKQIMFAGLDPVIAVTGEGGLRKALEYHPDLILLELDLTDMDGLELVSLLREKSQLDKIPIVAMSIFPYMKTAALYGGCDDFLKKPVRMIDLMAHLRHFLHGESLMQPYHRVLAG